MSDAVSGTSRIFTREGWSVLALVVAVNFVNTGFPAFGGTALMPFMASTMGWDRSSIGMVFSAYMLMSGMWGPVIAMAVARWGARATLVAGSLMVCAGSLGMAFVATSALGAVVGYGVLIGGGVGAGGLLVSQTIVARTIVERRSLALSMVLSAGAFGGVVAAPLVSWLAISTAWGWRAGWALLALLSAGIAILVLAKLREPPLEPPARSHPGTGGASPDGAEPSPTLREALGSASIWPVFLGVIGMSAALSFVLAHGPVHLRDLGFSSMALSTFLSLLTAGQLVGALAAGALADRFSARLLWAFSLLLMLAGMMLLQNPGTVPVLLLTGALFGLGLGGSMTGAMATPADYYGARLYPLLIGIVTQLITLSAAIASYLGGVSFDRSGSYGLAFGILTALLQVSALLLFVLKGRPRAVAA